MVKKRLTNNEDGDDAGEDEEKGKKKSKSKSAKKVLYTTIQPAFLTFLKTVLI